MSLHESCDLESGEHSPTLNDPEADVILRSSDSVDFRVRKAILSEVSTFFKDMFTLPHANTCMLEGLDVVPMAEDQEGLYLFLR